MAYIGKEPLTSFVSLKRQDITGDGTASYTLDHAVSSINDILVYVNHVKQDPSSMTVSGTSLTMGGTVASTDDFYVIFLGQALQTVTPADDSVTNSMLNTSVINSQTAETSIAGADEVLIYDTSASALRKMTRTNFVSGIGGTNTPAFHAYLSSSQSVSDNSNTKAQINTEIYDTDNCYDNSTNYRFTPTTAGKYFVYASVDCDSGYFLRFVNCKVQIKKNGSTIVAGFRHDTEQSSGVGDGVSTTGHVYATVDMNGSSDYVEVFGQVNNNGGTPEFEADNRKTYFGAYRIIT